MFESGFVPGTSIYNKGGATRGQVTHSQRKLDLTYLMETGPVTSPGGAGVYHSIVLWGGAPEQEEHSFVITFPFYQFYSSHVECWVLAFLLVRAKAR